MKRLLVLFSAITILSSVNIFASEVDVNPTPKQSVGISQTIYSTVTKSLNTSSLFGK